MMNSEISIRSIQHYLYCPHRWGLIEIGCSWAENVFVTKANIVHERVHNPENNYSHNGKTTFSSVQVYCDKPEYNLFGVTDCIEISADKNGVEIPGLAGKYNLCIVEYKPTKPKNEDYNEDDLMQVFAQKICVDYVFGCDCDTEIYYADVRKRFRLPIKENFDMYNMHLLEILVQMREKLSNGIIPEIRKNQNCNGCSMKDVCLPLKNKENSVKQDISQIMAGLDFREEDK